MNLARLTARRVRANAPQVTLAGDALCSSLITLWSWLYRGADQLAGVPIGFGARRGPILLAPHSRLPIGNEPAAGIRARRGHRHPGQKLLLLAADEMMADWGRG